MRVRFMPDGPSVEVKHVSVSKTGEVTCYLPSSTGTGGGLATVQLGAAREGFSYGAKHYASVIVEDGHHQQDGAK